VLLATHRELNADDVLTAELDAHLEQCPSCRNVLARYSLIGEQIRSLPALDPPPDMHAKLMRALATEHAQFMQRPSSPALPPPEFLKPYLRDHVHSSSKTDSLAAFSSAETGPLPIIRSTRKKQHRTFGQFAAIGLAAAFLMVLMMGGITSLLLLAHGQLGTEPPAPLIVNHPTDVAKISYKTSTGYNHVVSAVADQSSIYYTAYGDGENSNWMLEQLDRATKISTPLLPTASTNPLIVLGNSNDWLVWLQFDEPKITPHSIVTDHLSHSLIRTWSLQYLSLTGRSDGGIAVPNQPMTLLSGTFDQDVTPDWVHTPIQGTWFIQNTLLVAMVDENGTSHLVRYPLGEKNGFAATEIAKASPNHIFTSPTANNDGSQIFWAEEWRSDDENLHSDIWTQQVIDTMLLHGLAARHKMTVQQLFLQDGLSFTPVVVHNTLFLLSTADGGGLTPTTPNVTPVPTSSGTTVPVATPNTSTPPITSWANTNFYSAALDSSVRGTLVMYPLSNSLDASPALVSGATGSASSLQAGNDFVLWQNGDESYGMYDAVLKSTITVGDVLNDAQFLAVNGDTAVWTIRNTGETTGSTINPSATLVAFSWPMT
jgi:hypothetical protein